MPSAFLHGGSNGRRADTKSDQMILLIQYEAGIIRVDQRNKFRRILIDLLFVQIHHAIQRCIGGVDQLKDLFYIFGILSFAAELCNVILLLLHNVLCNVVYGLCFLAFQGGSIYFIFQPVNILVIAQCLQMVIIIRVIIIGDKHAALVEALYQHALPVHIAEA